MILAAQSQGHGIRFRSPLLIDVNTGNQLRFQKKKVLNHLGLAQQLLSASLAEERNGEQQMERRLVRVLAVVFMTVALSSDASVRPTRPQ